MDRYPLVSALSRPLIVKHLVAAAKYHGASMVAHGCTGKGNDQVRFEVGIGARAGPAGARPGPRLRHDPRQGDRVRRGEGPADRDDEEVAVLDRPERGRAVETGFLEDIWNGPIEDVYEYTQDPTVPGRPTRSSSASPPASRRRSTASRSRCCRRSSSSTRAGAQGVGRLDMVEDRLVGIKSREVYEAPGAIALITAHQELEAVTVERDLARFKRTVGQRWAELVYDGLWFSPLKKSLDAFIAESQQHVTGEIRMTLHGGRATVTGRRSEASLYDFNLATYDTGDTFDQGLAKGFVQLWGMPSKLAAPASSGCTAVPGRDL